MPEPSEVLTEAATGNRVVYWRIEITPQIAAKAKEIVGSDCRLRIARETRLLQHRE